MLRLDVMWILGRLARSDSLLKHHPKLFVCAWLLLLGSVHKVHFTVYSFGFHELTHISRDPAARDCNSAQFMRLPNVRHIHYSATAGG
jgi:hypothetical protein